jgi:hypothetical protein
MSIVDASTLHASVHVASNAWISVWTKIYKDKKKYQYEYNVNKIVYKWLF